MGPYLPSHLERRGICGRVFQEIQRPWLPREARSACLASNPTPTPHVSSLSFFVSYPLVFFRSSRFHRFLLFLSLPKRTWVNGRGTRENEEGRRLRRCRAPSFAFSFTLWQSLVVLSRGTKDFAEASCLLVSRTFLFLLDQTEREKEVKELPLNHPIPGSLRVYTAYEFEGPEGPRDWLRFFV